MMNLRLREGLPYVTATLHYQGQTLVCNNILLDTGSASTVFPTDKVLAVGLTYEPDDSVHRIRGVGGAEFVFTKRIDHLAIGALQVANFQIEVGAMDYGFDLDGIIGMDFLTEIGAVVDLAKLTIYPSITL